MFCTVTLLLSKSFHLKDHLHMLLSWVCVGTCLFRNAKMLTQGVSVLICKTPVSSPHTGELCWSGHQRAGIGLIEQWRDLSMCDFTHLVVTVGWKTFPMHTKSPLLSCSCQCRRYGPFHRSTNKWIARISPLLQLTWTGCRPAPAL